MSKIQDDFNKRQAHSQAVGAMGQISDLKNQMQESKGIRDLLKIELKTEISKDIWDNAKIAELAVHNQRLADIKARIIIIKQNLITLKASVHVNEYETDIQSEIDKL